MALIKWQPANDLYRFQDDLNRWWDTLAPQLPHALSDFTSFGSFGPRVDMYQTEKDIVLKAEIPGVEPNDLDVSVGEDSISIRGEMKKEDAVEDRNYYQSERRYGSFFRTIPLPAAADAEKAAAKYTNGLLEVVIPKAAPSKRNRKLQIQ